MPRLSRLNSALPLDPSFRTLSAQAQLIVMKFAAWNGTRTELETAGWAQLCGIWRTPVRAHGRPARAPHPCQRRGPPLMGQTPVTNWLVTVELFRNSR